MGASYYWANKEPAVQWLTSVPWTTALSPTWSLTKVLCPT